MVDRRLKMEEAVQIISQLGFPIAVCIYLFWSQNKEREDHKAETKAMTEALENNTIALEKILTKLGEDNAN